MNKKWKKNNAIFGGNFLLEGEDFYISFNKTPCKADTDKGETALCKDGNFFILNGDFTSEYEEIIEQGCEVCYKFYIKNKLLHGSSWSSDRYADNPLRDI